MRSVYLPLPVVSALLKPFYRVALDARLPVTVQRRILEIGAPIQTLPDGTVVQKLQLGGRPAERVTVGATERTTAILYLHGGAFTIGSMATHRSLAAHLARESASAVYVLDYRLAPENPFPAGLNDSVAAYRELLRRHGFTADRVAIAGDSAGGGLTVATARRLVDDGVTPAALGLISPWIDPAARDAQIQRDLVVNTAWSFAAAEAYLGDGDPLDQGYAPLQGDLGGLPPVVLHVGTSEVLYPQIVAFHEKLLLSGVDVDYVEYEKLWHVAHLQASILREAAEAVHHLGAFLGAHVRTSEVVLTEPASSDIA
ncbi:alpha/beta hydrolase [Rhodococcoides kyotonense]|uniref:Acetyl esterase/lipase n=1 Tax=Rhodococcoides kyotonense TaxID=398843 RepID=A0A239I331_9NOCA|nr:alpha/beta hydrolase [Rhodococcus kyotonensis]SNS87997.1 Acetyl esterase/lipase [Rhodococcus kyotonensis]